MFLLDGLDEVSGDSDALEHITHEINALAPQFSYIVTTRYTGFFGGIAEDGRYELIDLPDESIESLIVNWFKHHKGPDSVENAKVLIRQIFLNPRLHTMAQNPFLLTLLCYLQNNTDDGIPVVRSEVYGKLVQLIRQQLNNREKERVFQLSSVNALSEFSHYLYTGLSRAPAQIFTTDDWDQFAQDQRIDSDYLEGVYLKSRLITAMGAEGQDFYFTHLTFQEYFVAKALSSLAPEQALIHIYKPHWHVVIRFLGGMYVSQSRHDDYKTLLRGILSPVDELGLMYVEAAWLLMEAGVEDSSSVLGYDLRIKLWDKVLAIEEYLAEAASEALATLSPNFVIRKCSQYVDDLKGKYESVGFSSATAKEVEQLRDVVMLIRLVPTREADKLLMSYAVETEDAIRSYALRAISDRNTPQIRQLVLEIDSGILVNVHSICFVASETGHLLFFDWLITKFEEWKHPDNQDKHEIVCEALEEFDLASAKKLIEKQVNKFSVEMLPQRLSRLYQIAFAKFPPGLRKFAMKRGLSKGDLEHLYDAIELGTLKSADTVGVLKSLDTESLEELLPAIESRFLNKELFDPEVSQFLALVTESTPELAPLSIHLLSQLELVLDLRGLDSALNNKFYRRAIVNGEQSIRAELGEYRGLPFMVSVTIFFGFDKNGRLIDIWVWKTANGI